MAILETFVTSRNAGEKMSTKKITKDKTNKTPPNLVMSNLVWQANRKTQIVTIAVTPIMTSTMFVSWKLEITPTR